MRISLWPVLVCGWMLAVVVGQTGFAVEPADYRGRSTVAVAAGEDDDYGESDDSYSAWEEQDEGLLFQPVQYVDPGMGGMQGYAPDPYGGYPPNAWPDVSPYTQHSMQEMYNEAGLWQYETNDDQVKNIIGVDFLYAWGLRPGTQRIGAGQPPAGDLLFSPNDNYLNTTTSTTTGTSGTTTSTTNNNNINGTNNQDITNYGPRSTAVFTNPKHYGVRARYGWENPDESGFLLSGFYLADRQQTILARPLNAAIGPLASIAYNNGVTGVLALFDSLFTQTYDQQFWGADADFFASPFFKRPSFKIGMTYGVKYLRVSESFSVHAMDSSTSGNYGPGETIQSLTNDGPLPPVLETWISARTNSNLIGPSVGIKYDLGGEKFKLWGQTKVAVAANIEEMRVFGRNAYGNTDFLLYGYTEFNNTRSVTHISPILDQSIYGEFPLFAMLPIVNKVRILNTSMFRVGWNYVLIGEASRPANIISYNLNDPTVRTNRTWMSISTVSFGLDWKF